MTEIIKVVSAVIIRDGLTFLTQRKKSQSYPLHWECAGGKVEPGETNVQAVERELGEELFFGHWLPFIGIYSEPLFAAILPGTEGRSYDLSMHKVEIGSAWPVGREGQGSGWFTALQMKFLTLAPGNRAASEIITAEILASEPKEIGVVHVPSVDSSPSEFCDNSEDGQHVIDRCFACGRIVR